MAYHIEPLMQKCYSHYTHSMSLNGQLYYWQITVTISKYSQS